MTTQQTKPTTRKTAPGQVPLYVLSDSTGNLARHMVTTYLTQFPDGTFAAQMKPFVNEPRRLKKAFDGIAAHPGVVLHAVVSPRLKMEISARCRGLGIACCDLTGSAMEFLANAVRVEPLIDQSRLHRVDDVYCGRINAMSFTLEHDDGLGSDGLGDADIVLTGVSRTGKTPTSIYLAMLGFRVANVPLAVQVQPPGQLFELGPGKVIGLTIDPLQLAEIRARRQTGWRMAQTDYSDPRKVQEEAEWSRQVFAKLRCPVLDVTNQAIEETAGRVLDALGLNQPAPGREEGLS
jgi:[pyruvate, water dikinase]-phosphate phosphotransferase / [pyruvate, water dikinase] kinase